MKVISISIYEKNQDTRLICTVKNLKHISYFQKSTICEFLDFFSKTIVERVPEKDKQRNQCITERGYKCHLYVNFLDVSCVVITDEEYPSKTAFQLIQKIYQQNMSILKENTKLNIFLCDLLQKYQDPANVDPIINLQKEMDETKDILHKTLDSVLKREETLDELIKKSTELSNSSKTFYIKTKKMNSCCVIL